MKDGRGKEEGKRRRDGGEEEERRRRGWLEIREAWI